MRDSGLAESPGIEIPELETRFEIAKLRFMPRKDPIPDVVISSFESDRFMKNTDPELVKIPRSARRPYNQAT